MTVLKLAEIYVPQIKKIQKGCAGLEYTNMHLQPNLGSLDDALEDKVLLEAIFAEMRRVYTMGILERSHLVCIVSLSRSERWIEGVAQAKKQNNFILFCSALRGLLESCADSHDILAYLPQALVKHFKYIYLVLIKSSDISNIQLGFGPLEDKLIHFVYAQKNRKNSNALPHHDAKTNKTYIEQLEKFDVPDLAMLYSELCQYAHPASPTVQGFVDEGSGSLILNFSKDELIIDDILSRYEKVIEKLIMYPFNSALSSMAVLEKFNPTWVGPGDSSLYSIGNWRAILESMDKFVNSYVEGSVNPDDMLAELR